MHIDPHTTQEITDLGVRLSEAALRNGASSVIDKLKAIRTSHKEKEQVQQLEEIIYDLIDDKNDLREIAEAYKAKFVAQQISQEEIAYITDSLIPVLKELIEKAPNDENDATAAANIEQVIDFLEPLLSVKMLTVLQLVGFNFKQAIGEPLTFLLQRYITSKAPADPQSKADHDKLAMAFNLEVAKIAQDQGAAERWERWRAK